MDVLGNLEVRWVQGFNNGTFRFVDKKTTCYTCGNFIVFLNVETKMRKTLQSPGSGIGAFTASGHRRCLAFSDLNLNPSIFVYNYPELELMCELKGKTKLGYTALAMCDTGPYLVCASSMPDHTITLCAVDLPATDGSVIESEANLCHMMTVKHPCRKVVSRAWYCKTVTYLLQEWFDQGGNFLITGASDSRMFVLNARPSKGFEIIGWIEAPGAIVSLSTQYLKESKQVKVLVLCNKTEREINEGNLLLLLTLFVQQITGQVCAAAVPLMLAGWSWICLFRPRQSDPHHHRPEGRLACLQQAQIKAMMEENESLPDMEKLEHQEFNLDVEEQQRLQLEGEQEVTRVKKEIEMENLAKCYQREILKKECWDSMQVKGKAIKAFHSENEVKNYPMKERTEKELEELQRVETMRQIEQEDSQLQEMILNTISGEKENEEEEDSKTESPALTGSLSALYGGVNPHLYSQFNLHIREQKINQITLLKDIIYKVKSTFNKEFEAVYKQKDQEINRLREKNKRIAEIMTELDLSETLWEPILTDNECPERALTVTDSEIKVEKYLTPKQKEKEEKLREEEERQRLAAKSDNTRDQALNVMMGGVLELKKEDVLRMEVPQPEFMSKPELQWTEEERKSFKEFEKKAKELNEEKEKYKKTLETEMKKLLTSIKEATQMFDEKLTTLFERKVKSEMVIYQEELKIANLVHSIQTEEEILSREKQLSLKLEKARTVKNEIGEELKKHKEIVDEFREEYDNTVAEDKLLDKGFRKEFFDVPGHIIDQLYKLYKRRPRVQRMKTQTENNQFKEGGLLGTAPSDGLSLMMKAMEELDAPENMPEGLDLVVWERFCMARRTKVESEQKVKLKALTLAEMQAFLQRRTDEDEKAHLEIKNLIDELNR
ncbi:cilia- and flagella-associated 43 [Labeo rohita]|uniref:Cilia- and flagella-associated protein 43 n=1 Tax=Labeo rohita TaxID=84645 RepID=A0A498N0V7_LABRO|nr:cilia- and flagella-associated 43 [Labeo rohita]